MGNKNRKNTKRWYHFEIIRYMSIIDGKDDFSYISKCWQIDLLSLSYAEFCKVKPVLDNTRKELNDTLIYNVLLNAPGCFNVNSLLASYKYMVKSSDYISFSFDAVSLATIKGLYTYLRDYVLHM